MGRYGTYPTLYDEVLQIDISKLKEWRYLEPGTEKEGTLLWRYRGEVTSRIGIKVTMREGVEQITLTYTCNGKSRNYAVTLTSIPSNLGIGQVWYFVCPKTEKRCRKLYLVDGYFLHREAFSGCFYQKQVESKKYRGLDKVYGSYFKLDQLYEELYRGNFRKYYAGKPTKKYARLLHEIEEAERIPVEEIETLLTL